MMYGLTPPESYLIVWKVSFDNHLSMESCDIKYMEYIIQNQHIGRLVFAVW